MNDFKNAENPSFLDDATEDEFMLNDLDVAMLFEGDIEYDSNEDLPGFGNIADRKWKPKVGPFVQIPYTFPDTTSARDKAEIAKTVKEFRTKTCIK